jgi:hypothetical protein
LWSQFSSGELRESDQLVSVSADDSSRKKNAITLDGQSHSKLFEDVV